MTIRHTSVEGLTFEYSYNNFPNAAYFSVGQVSIVYSVPFHTWREMSLEERHKWRQEKYAQAMRHFNLKEAVGHGADLSGSSSHGADRSGSPLPGGAE